MQAADLSNGIASLSILRVYVGTYNNQTCWQYLSSLYSFHTVSLELEILTLAGWTMVFKVVGGASPPDVGQLWASPNTHAENINDALDTTTTHNGHYKNRIVMNWQTFPPQQVRNYEEGLRRFLKIVKNLTSLNRGYLYHFMYPFSP